MGLFNTAASFALGLVRGFQDPIRAIREVATGRFEGDLAHLNDDSPSPGHGSDFPTHMQGMASAMGTFIQRLTDCICEFRVDGYPVMIHAGGAVYTHSQITFNRRVPLLDSAVRTANRNTAFTCDVVEAGGQYALYFFRRIPLAAMSAAELKAAIIDAGVVASAMDDALRQQSGG